MKNFCGKCDFTLFLGVVPEQKALLNGKLKQHLEVKG